MALNAPRTSTITPVPKGTHIARLYQIVHIGTVRFTLKGEEKAQDKIRLTFELCNERKEFKEGEGEKPFSISREFGFTMGKKSHLRPFVEGMLGIALHDDEAYSFDLEQLLGEACLINVTHDEKEGNTYANIKSASPLARGMIAPEIFNETSIVDVDTATQEQIEALPEFLSKKIKESDNYKRRFGMDEPKDDIRPEDNPF